MNRRNNKRLRKVAKRNQMRRPMSRNKITIRILTCLSFLGIMGTLFFALKYLQSQKTAVAAISQVTSDFEKEINSSDKVPQQEVEVLLEQKTEQTKQEVLNELKTQMKNGKGTVAMLRYFFPNELVIMDGNEYFFMPILDTLKKHDYMDENFVLSEEGIMEYQIDNKTTSIKGIDVSQYQGNIDWQKVKADDVNYAFIRLGIRGYGTGKLVLDEKYVDNMNGALEAGVEVGTYFVTQATSVDEAKEEAKFVLENMESFKDKVTYPVVLDVEEVLDKTARTSNLTMEQRTEMIVAFCEEIKNAGYQPMLYGNLKSFLLMMDIKELEVYPKWFANYSQPVYYPYDFHLWQYTAKGKVNGIKGDVDLNIQMKKIGE